MLSIPIESSWQERNFYKKFLFHYLFTITKNDKTKPLFQGESVQSKLYFIFTFSRKADCWFIVDIQIIYTFLRFISKFFLSSLRAKNVCTEITLNLLNLEQHKTATLSYRNKKNKALKNSLYLLGRCICKKMDESRLFFMHL